MHGRRSLGHPPVLTLLLGKHLYFPDTAQVVLEDGVKIPQLGLGLTEQGPYDFLIEVHHYGDQRYGDESIDSQFLIDIRAAP
jgi:hypothetical protein